MIKDSSSYNASLKFYISRIDCNLVDFDYKVSRFVIQASDRLNERAFVNHDFKLFDEFDETISSNYFVSNYHACRMIEKESASHILHSNDFNIEDKSRVTRINKSETIKRKLHKI